MPHTRRLILLILLIPFLVAAAAGSSACSNANPAGPSPSSAGATITGSLVAERTLSGVTVAVSGTKLGAMVGTSQEFTISDVPSGTVRLMFRGPDLNGAIDLTGVQPADTIELVVRVNGSAVVLDSEHRRRKDDDDDAAVKFDGVLTSRTGTPPTLVLTVGGRTVRTNASTTVRKDGQVATFDALVVGARLAVAGTRETDGSVLARRIEIQGDDGDADVKFDGVLTSRAGAPPTLVLTVAGRTVRTDASTVVRRDGRLATLNALVVGQRLAVAGTRETDGSVLAERIEIQDRDDADPCGPEGGEVNRNLDLVGDCTITGRVNGNIRISNGTLIVEGVVNGNVEQSGTGGVTVRFGAFVNGNVIENGTGGVTVGGTVTGKVEEADEGDVVISVAGSVSEVVEKGFGDVEVNGTVTGNVEENDIGSVLGTGFVNGNVKESGPGFIAPGLRVKGNREEGG